MQYISPTGPNKPMQLRVNFDYNVNILESFSFHQQLLENYLPEVKFGAVKWLLDLPLHTTLEPSPLSYSK